MPVFPSSTKYVLPSPFLAVVALSWTHQHHRKTALNLSRHAVVLHPAQYSWRNLNGRVLPETNAEQCVQRDPTPVNNRMTSNCLTYTFSSIFLCQYAFILNCLKHRGYDACTLHTHSFCIENNSEMQQLRFILRKRFYSTCFGWQSHPSSGVHVLYMATGKQTLH